MAAHASKQQPVASRQLRIQRGDETISTIHIEIYSPTLEDEEEWHCRYRIVGLTSRPIDESSVGVDGIQALHLTIQRIANWMSVMENEPGCNIQWPEGSSFDNAELCEKASGPQHTGANARSRAEAILNWEIKAAFSVVRNDPDGAKLMFQRLRRRAVRRGLTEESVHCLYGLLAVARQKRDTKRALKVATIIAERQPSIENMLMCANEFTKHGQDDAAGMWYERVLPQLEEGTSLYQFVSKKLARTRAARRAGGGKSPPTP